MNKEKTLWTFRKHRNTPSLYFLSLMGNAVLLVQWGFFLILQCDLAVTFLQKLQFLLRKTAKIELYFTLI